MSRQGSLNNFSFKDFPLCHCGSCNNFICYLYNYMYVQIHWPDLTINVWKYYSLSPPSLSLFLPSRDLNLTTHLLIDDPWLTPAPLPDLAGADEDRGRGSSRESSLPAGGWAALWESCWLWRWKEGRWNMLDSPDSSTTGDSRPGCFRVDSFMRDLAKKFRILGTRDREIFRAPAIIWW